MAARFSFWSVNDAVRAMGIKNFNVQIALAIVEGLGDEEERSKWANANLAAHLHNAVSRILLSKGMDLHEPFKTASDFLPKEPEIVEVQSNDEIASTLKHMMGM